jgi:hypothetical protein
MFNELALNIAAYRRGSEAQVLLARQILLIKSWRRITYFLAAK